MSEVLKKSTENKNASIAKTNKGKLTTVSKTILSKFNKEQEASRLLSNLELKISLSKIHRLSFFKEIKRMK